jgi:N-acetylglucosamine-6-phosphate deacetylase
MRILISDGIIVTPDDVLKEYTLVIEDGKIAKIEDKPQTTLKEDLHIDARGCWVAPGLIDIHIHGSYGFDTMDATPDALHGMAYSLVKHGVTSYLPTIITAPEDAMWVAIENIKQCPQPYKGAQHLGAHIEGPYLNKAHRGAHPPNQLRKPNPKEYRAWLDTGVVRLITIAPELDGALELFNEGNDRGVKFSIGHSGASYEQVLDYADRGLRQATHVFNGMLGLHHRLPGTVGAVLTDDRIFGQVISDGVHLHPAVVKLIVQCKGKYRTILISDATRATGLRDGEYAAGGLKYVVKQGIARTLEGGLAGSTLTLDVALRNIMSYTGLPFQEVIPMATSVPSEAIGLKGQKGILAPGADADIAIFDPNFMVQYTIIAGEIAYKNDNHL